MVGQGLAAMATQAGFLVQRCSRDEAGAKDAVRQSDEALVIIGAGTKAGGLDGPALATRLVREQPRLRILAVFNARNLERFSAMARAQALGYIHEDHLENELPTALEALASDRFYVSTCFTAKMRRELSLVDAISRRCDEAKLSPRQRQVCLCLVMGRNQRETGEALNLSRSAVESHCARARAALDVSTTRELIEVLLMHRTDRSVGPP